MNEKQIRSEFALDDNIEIGLVHADLMRIIHDHRLMNIKKNDKESNTYFFTKFDVQFPTFAAWNENLRSPSLSKIEFFRNHTGLNLRFVVEQKKQAYEVVPLDTVQKYLELKIQKRSYKKVKVVSDSENEESSNIGVLHNDFVYIVKSFQDRLNTVLGADKKPIISYENFANRMGVGLNIFTRWMTNDRTPCLSHLTKFAKANMHPFGMEIRLIIDDPSFKFIPREKAEMPEHGVPIIHFVKI